MNVRFVNHASVVFQSGDVCLLTDPWFEGLAFNDGWRLLCETDLPADVLGRVTHLWISHEHPDHFCPRSLRSIPADVRSRITLLYRQSPDLRVAEFCRTLGFKDVQLLPLGETVTLGDGFEVLCDQYEDDSWLLVRSPTTSVLNLNDCQVGTREELEEIRSAIGSVDVLLTQFSVSAWDGNEEEVERRARGAQTMIDRVILQTEVLEPGYVIPFASFVVFCHAENHFMNSCVRPIADVCSAVETRTAAQSVLLYPGDVWEPGLPAPTEDALRRYEAAGVRAAALPPVTSARVDEGFLRDAVRGFMDRARSRIPMKTRARVARIQWIESRESRPRSGWKERLREALSLVTLRVRPARLYLSDYDSAYLFDPVRGLQKVQLSENECDIALSSDSFCHCVRFRWGDETLIINGRFRELRRDGRRRFLQHLWVQRWE